MSISIQTKVVVVCGICGDRLQEKDVSIDDRIGIRMIVTCQRCDKKVERLEKIDRSKKKNAALCSICNNPVLTAGRIITIRSGVHVCVCDECFKKHVGGDE